MLGREVRTAPVKVVVKAGRFIFRSESVMVSNVVCDGSVNVRVMTRRVRSLSKPASKRVAGRYSDFE